MGEYVRILAKSATKPSVLLRLTLVGGAPVIITGLAVSCGGIFMLQVLATGFVPTAATQAQSAAVGLYTSAYYFGGSVGAIAPSLVWQRFGWPGCVGFILVVHVALLLVARRLWGPRGPQLGLAADEAVEMLLPCDRCWIDNVFIERLWRSLKHEEVYLRAYESISPRRAGISVLSSSCTIGAVRIRASITGRPMRCSMTGSACRWRPERGLPTGPLASRLRGAGSGPA